MAWSSNNNNSLIAGLTAGGILVFYSIYMTYQVYRDSKKNEEKIEKTELNPCRVVEKLVEKNLNKFPLNKHKYHNNNL